MNLIFVLITLFAMSAIAAPKAKESVPANQFREQFQAGMIKGFCKETKFTAECFDMTTETCEANIKSSIVKCMRDKPPGKEVAAENVKPYSVALGSCVGADFNKRNASRLRRTSECQNPLEWLNK